MAFRGLSSRLAASGARHGHGIHIIKWQQWPRFFSAEAVSQPSNLVQVYISRSTDPYLNLSVEHFLLQKSHPQSVVLFLYSNRPCIVIGRNQNPWVEVNLGLVSQPGILQRLRTNTETAAGYEETAGRRETDISDDDVLLVRRRSGGGTVFHDAGNMNYSVICPPASFDRDKHAEMVVRALRSLDIPHGVRVNERHDIVLDVSSSSAAAAAANSSLPPAEKTGMNDSKQNGEAVKIYKISGSAYKLTRTRSLHHGTCLLSSPHLPFLSRLLRSPAAPYIKARGVESVRSPVRNVGVSNSDFEEAVVSEFRAMYEAYRTEPESDGNATTGAANEEGQQKEKQLPDSVSEGRRDQENKPKIHVETIDATAVSHIPEIQAGVAELSSRDWIYAQTPQFVFSSHPTTDDPRPRPDLPTDLPSSFFPVTPSDADLVSSKSTTRTTAAPGLQMTVRHAEITDVVAPDSGSDLVESLKGLHLHRLEDWRVHVGDRNETVGRWLNGLFGLSPQKRA